jgi:hypothetical protein
MSIEEQTDSDNLPTFPLCPESVDGEPITWNKVMNELDTTHFQQAGQAKYDSLSENKKWTLVPLPEGRKPIDNTWVMKRKLDENGNITKHKARLCGREFSQILNEDYYKTFAPVMKG